MNSTTVTDLDYFVALGHSEDAVREALRVTNGNRNAALYILVKGDTGDKKNNTAWRKEMPEDWQFGVAKYVPNMAENRALHKSPIYAIVETYRPLTGNDYEFVMKVTLKDGREWKIGKTYSQFSSFKFSLPFGTCFSFQNSFPQPVMVGSWFGEYSSAFLERRRQALSEWMRELVLNEACMSSPAVLDLLYAFIDADAHGGRVGLASSPPVTPTSPSADAQKANTWAPPPPPSPLLAAAYDSQHAAALKKKQLYFSQARLLENDHLPLSLEQITQMVPVKVNVKKLQCYTDLMAAKRPKPKLKPKPGEMQDRQESVAVAEVVVDAATDGVAGGDAGDEKGDGAGDETGDAGGVGEGEKSKTEPLGTQTTTTSSAADHRHHHHHHPTESAGGTVKENPAAEPTVNTSSGSEKVNSNNAASIAALLADIDVVQLRKDCKRDRIVIQGRRFEGSHNDLDSILRACRESVMEVVTRSGRSITQKAPKSAHQLVEGSITDIATATGSSSNSRSGGGVVEEQDLGDAGGAERVSEELPAATAGEDGRRGRNPFDSPSPSPPPSPPLSPISLKSPSKASPVIITEESSSSAAVGSSSKSAPPSVQLAEEDEDDDDEEEDVGGFDVLAKCALHMISRTESAYLSHASLHDILDMENKHAVPDFQPYLFVPEATLAEPLQLRFSIIERNNLTVARSRFTRALADEWCVECQGETSTVYRLLDAMELRPLLQLRVTYVVTLFGMPLFQNGPLSSVTGLTVKEGKCQLVIDRVTATTSRDWTKCS